jgi:hypothetical protein
MKLVFLLLIFLNSALSAQTIAMSKADEKPHMPCEEMLGLWELDSCFLLCSYSLEHKTTLSIEEYILCAKLWNSLYLNGMNTDNEPYRSYLRLFDNNLLKIIEALEAKLSKGMGHYSKKYNIDIGGSPHPNSYFCIKDL